MSSHEDTTMNTTATFIGYSIREVFGDLAICYRRSTDSFSVLNLSGEVVSEGHRTREEANVASMEACFGEPPATIETSPLAA